jgi:hypothetical protein
LVVVVDPGVGRSGAQVLFALANFGSLRTPASADPGPFAVDPGVVFGTVTP